MNSKRFVTTFWALDRSRAQARFYPAIHPLVSYAADTDVLAKWWQTQGNPDWPAQRRDLLTLPWDIRSGITIGRDSNLKRNYPYFPDIFYSPVLPKSDLSLIVPD